MHSDLLVGLALILVLGIGSQWLAWRINTPSILLLLLVGVFVGPVTGWLQIDAIFGDLLFPVVSLSVAIILFEGGLSLRFDDIRGSGGVVRNLVSIGVVATWVISALAAHFLLGLDVALSILLGATLVVTGPTVIIPLLNQIRPSGRVASILRWEGIVIDPVGAVLAVLVFEEILVSDIQEGIVVAIVTLAQTLLIGGIVGVVVARGMVELYARSRVPERLQNSTTLMFVLAAFALSNTLQPESGLLTVTVMGIIMANQKRFDIDSIVEFKESIQIPLLSTLFILLAARIQPEQLQAINLQVLIFIGIVILVERPLAVWLSTWNMGLSWQERLFLSWMAPRGIVAASVASIFALELADHGHEGAELLVPYTFAVIIGTVTVYSLTAGPLARALGLSEKNPQGLLIVGASGWVRKFVLKLREVGFEQRIVVVDSNPANVERARTLGIEAVSGNVLSEVIMDEVSLSGIGKLLAMTSNDDVNTLAGEHFKRIFGADEIYQLQRQDQDEEAPPIASSLGGKFLFPPGITYENLRERFYSGVEVTSLAITDPQAVAAHIPDTLLPLLLATPEGDIQLWTSELAPTLLAQHTLICLVHPDYDDLQQTAPQASTLIGR